MANCENVDIKIRNRTGVDVRVSKFEYTNGTQTQTEHMFFGGSDRIDAGEEREYTRDLEGIGGKNTTYTVTYQHRVGNNWGANRVETLSDHCDDNDDVTITLTD